MVSNLTEHGVPDDSYQYLGGLDDEANFITKEEIVYFTIDEVIFDTGSTIYLMKNEKLLTQITDTAILMEQAATLPQ
jgi:hypothetical protein